MVNCRKLSKFGLDGHEFVCYLFPEMLVSGGCHQVKPHSLDDSVVLPG